MTSLPTAGIDTDSTIVDQLAHDSWAAWKTWAVVLALAMTFGLIEVAQLRLGSSVLGQGIPIGVALVQVMPYWLLAACAMPLLVVIGRRFRIWKFLLRPNVPAMVATAGGFALLALIGRALVSIVDVGSGVASRPTPLQLFQAYFPLDLLTYTAFVGTLYAFHYYREARRREITASRLQASLAEERLRGLEARVDQDFLFNTLNDISRHASRGQQKRVIETLERLSEILRAALSDERPDEIPLGREIELLESCQQAGASAAQQPSAINYALSPNVLGALVPRAILPSLVDSIGPGGNAALGERRQITIRGVEEEDRLRLEIVDSATCLAPGDDTQREIGLLSVRTRLERLYGRSQSMTIETSDERTILTMLIPLRHALAGEDAGAR